MPNLRNRVAPTNSEFRSKKRLPNAADGSYKFDAGHEQQSSKNSCRDHDAIQYISEAVSILEKGFKDNTEKGQFIENVLEETVGKEVELCCDRVASRCIEILLEDCRNPYLIMRYMEAFSHSLDVVCVDQCASHIAEKLLHTSLSIVKNLPLAAEPADVEEKNNIRTAFGFWAYKFGQFCCENLELCLNDTYGCHVLSAVIQLLGCCCVNESASLRKVSKKGHTAGKHAGHESLVIVAEIFPSVPTVFLDLLQHIGLRTLECGHLSDLIFDSRSSHVIQILLLVLKKRNLKCFAKVKQALLSIIFSKRNHEGVPLALCDRSSSYIMEKIVELSDEHEQELIWMGISECLPQLILHPIGNYTIQRFFYSVLNKQQFESMFDATIDHFEKILENKYFGIWLSVAKSCNRLKTRQIQFVTKMMQVLQCSKPAERDSYFAQLLLQCETYHKHQKEMETASQISSLHVNLFGSLILQEILEFLKPIKVVKSILSMKSEMLMFLACQEQGCHVLTSFLESANISKKDKEKLIQQLKPVLVSIACDHAGSLTLSRMWSLLSMDQKFVIAKELTEKKSSLLQHKSGIIISKKFALFHFEHRVEKWKEIQRSYEKHQKILKDIVT